MALYFNADDLTVRRVAIATWACKQVKKLAASYHYGQLISGEYMMNYQYVIALSEAIACYSPITSEAENGVKNCLTEEELECAFNNISEITCIGWMGKNASYRNFNPTIFESGQLTSDVTLSDGGVLGVTAVPDGVVSISTVFS